MKTISASEGLKADQDGLWSRRPSVRVVTQNSVNYPIGVAIFFVSDDIVGWGINMLLLKCLVEAL